MHKRRQSTAASVFGNVMVEFDLGTLDNPFRHLRMEKLLGAVHTYAVGLPTHLGRVDDAGGMRLGWGNHSDQACIPATCIKRNCSLHVAPVP